jgi:MspA protein
VLSEEFESADPSAAVTDFRVQIDCLGQAFVRSYAVLTRSTDTVESVVAYYGVPIPVVYRSRPSTSVSSGHTWR